MPFNKIKRKGEKHEFAMVRVQRLNNKTAKIVDLFQCFNKTMREKVNFIFKDFPLFCKIKDN
jgi:hypothetical protein